jgi:tape measure domain-containing protein
VVSFLINAIVNPAGAIAGSRAVERSLLRINNQADALRASLGRTFAFIGVASGIRSLLEYADTLTNVQNRLKLTARTQEEVNEATQRLLDISVRTRSSFEGTAELYNRTALAARELGRDQEELAQFTESLNQAIILSGAGAGEAKAALIQLSQGIAAGALRGEELRSVMEQLPVVADVVGARLGLTRGEVQRLGIQGKITSELILDAFKDAREELAVRFASTIPTVSQAFEVLRTKIVEFVDKANSSTGATEKFAQVILLLSENAELLVRSFGALAAFMATEFTAGAIVKTINALRVLSIALLTNPIFLIGTLIAGSVAALVGFGDQIIVAKDGIADLRDVAIAAFEAISQVLAPVIDEISNTLEVVFAGQIPTIREFAEAFAQTFDQIVGAVRGTVLLVNDLLASQLPSVYEGAVAQSRAFGLRLLQVFQEVANFLANLFLDPIQTILRSLQALISSVAGSAAVLKSLGLISEESRLGVEDAVSTIEVALANLQNRKPIQIFDTDKTLKEVRDLEAQAAESFSKVGDTLQQSFLEGFQQDTVLGFVRSIFDDAEVKAAERRERAKQQAELDRQLLPPGTEGGVFGPRTAPAARLSNDAQKLLEQVDAQAQLNEQTLIFNEALNARKDLAVELENAFLASQIAALEASTSMEDGFTRAFLKIKQEAQDFASVAEQAVNIFTNKATDAIFEFTQTGELNFKEFAVSVLQEITRILIRLLLVQAITAALGFAGIGGGGIADAAANLGTQQLNGGGGGRARGGTVQPDRSYVVGENGPELFRPGTTGTIIPNAGAAEPPQVNVQVVNVDDPKAVPNAIQSGGADEAILNVLARNKSRVSQIVR